MSTESLFEQAYHEVSESLGGIADQGDYAKWRILDRLREPDAVYRFTVRWVDSLGKVRQNPGWRVQHCNAIGPYKGGLRFTDSVTEDMLRFLAFEQCFKNALTGLPMGGGKGGARFDPRPETPEDIMRFCQAFADKLADVVGEDIDVPAGDMGVGGREVGWIATRYRARTRRHTGTFTGKPVEIGGILGRTEATGYGTVEFAAAALEHAGKSYDGKRVLISGAGNVATYAVERTISMGGKALTLSARAGCAHFADGMTTEQLEDYKDAHENQGVHISDWAKKAAGVEWRDGVEPWDIDGDLAMPCATQNEVDGEEAKTLAKQGVIGIFEGANMPCTDEAHKVFRDAGVIVGPGKAANAGGVATSGLEMSQNAAWIPWTRERTLDQLSTIMTDIHAACAEHGGTTDKGVADYVNGANVAGFKRLADAIIAGGVV